MLFNKNRKVLHASSPLGTKTTTTAETWPFMTCKRRRPNGFKVMITRVIKFESSPRSRCSGASSTTMMHDTCRRPRPITKRALTLPKDPTTADLFDMRRLFGTRRCTSEGRVTTRRTRRKPSLREQAVLRNYSEQTRETLLCSANDEQLLSLEPIQSFETAPQQHRPESNMMHQVERPPILASPSSSLNSWATLPMTSVTVMSRSPSALQRAYSDLAWSDDDDDESDLDYDDDFQDSLYGLRLDHPPPDNGALEVVELSLSTSTHCMTAEEFCEKTGIPLHVPSQATKSLPSSAVAPAVPDWMTSWAAGASSPPEPPQPMQREPSTVYDQTDERRDSMSAEEDRHGAVSTSPELSRNGVDLHATTNEFLQPEAFLEPVYLPGRSQRESYFGVDLGWMAVSMGDSLLTRLEGQADESHVVRDDLSFVRVRDGKLCLQHVDKSETLALSECAVSTHQFLRDTRWGRAVIVKSRVTGRPLCTLLPVSLPPRHFFVASATECLVSEPLFSALAPAMATPFLTASGDKQQAHRRKLPNDSIESLNFGIDSQRASMTLHREEQEYYYAPDAQQDAAMNVLFCLDSMTRRR